MEPTRLSATGSTVFSLLVSPTLWADEVMALPLEVRTMYLVAKIKAVLSPLLYDSRTGTIALPLEECIPMVCLRPTQVQSGVLASELVAQRWATPVRSGRVRLRRSEEITRLLIALILHNESGLAERKL